MLKNKKGITLIALIITVIILLLLAGITISSLTGSGFFSKTQEAEQKQENAQILENSILEEYENIINTYVSAEKIPGSPTLSKIEEAIKKGTAISTEKNTELQDAYGNKIVVPAGFKITSDATTVDKGIVIEDVTNEATLGSQFVWIPVPKSGYVYKDANGTKANDIEIKLDRYTFADDEYATPTAQGTNKIESYYQELETSTLGNKTAKSISDFKNSVAENEGYYIGRYEARDGEATKARTDGTSDSHQLVCTANNYVYTWVQQNTASSLSRNMYTSTEFTSDLMNSYAWDTAALFLQECGSSPTYSRHIGLHSSFATTGTNNETLQDVQCNVFDMGGNYAEWTTETSSYTISGQKQPCVQRGGLKNSDSWFTVRRNCTITNSSSTAPAFRPLLYLNLNESK